MDKRISIANRVKLTPQVRLYLWRILAETREMPDSENNRSRSSLGIAPHRWRSGRILEAVYQVNEHLVGTLTELARRGNTAPLVVTRNADALCRLDAVAAMRAARIPVLLLDLHFQRDEWWRNVGSLKDGVGEATVGWRGLAAEQAAELTREALIVAWRAVHEAPQSARLLFGMSDTVASVISELSPQQLDRTAARSRQELRIRWESESSFWQNLLAAARSGDTNELCEIYLRGVQLLGGELMKSSE